MNVCREYPVVIFRSDLYLYICVFGIDFAVTFVMGQLTSPS